MSAYPGGLYCQETPFFCISTPLILIRKPTNRGYSCSHKTQMRLNMNSPGCQIRGQGPPQVPDSEGVECSICAYCLLFGSGLSPKVALKNMECVKPCPNTCVPRGTKQPWSSVTPRAIYPFYQGFRRFYNRECGGMVNLRGGDRLYNADAEGV